MRPQNVSLAGDWKGKFFPKIPEFLILAKIAIIFKKQKLTKKINQQTKSAGSLVVGRLTADNPESLWASVNQLHVRQV